MNRIAILITAALLVVSTAEGADKWEAFLTQRDASDVARDGRYIWLTTAGGVLRWDTEGTGSDEDRYDVFLPQDGLAAVEAVSVAVDRHHGKWFAHSAPDAGVSLLDSAGNWSNLSSFDGLGLAPGKGVNVVHAAGDSIWIGTESGATLFENGVRRILLTEDDDGILSDNISAIETFDGEVWLGTERGVSRFDLHGVRNYTAQTDSLPNNQINVLAVDPSGKLWVGTGQGIAWIRDDEVIPVEGLAPLAKLIVRDISFEIDSFGEIIPWFATNDGPYRGNTRLAVQTNSGDPIGAPSETNAILVDSTGAVWFANGDRWLFEFDRGQQAWDNHRLPGLVTNFISDVVVDRSGFVWTSNAENVDVAPPGEQRGIHLFTGTRWTNINPGKLSQTIVGVAVDSSGNRWFASRATEPTAGNLLMLDASIQTVPDSTDFVHFDIGAGALNTEEGGQPAYNVEVDPFGNVWALVIREGIAALDTLRDEQRWGVWTAPECLRLDDFASGVFAPSVIDIAFTPDGRAWVALLLSFATTIDYGSSLDNGVDDDCFQWRLSNSPIPNKLRTVRVDPRGRVWFGSESGGLALFDPSDSTWATYTRESTNGGLPDNQIHAIAFDHSGNTWVGTFGGGIGILRPDGTTWLEPYTVESNARRGSGLTANDIQAIRIVSNDEGNDIAWIATWGGGVIRMTPDFSEAVGTGETSRPEVVPFPNPYIAGEEDRDGIVFPKTPVGGVIDIYTLTGEFVYEVAGPSTAVEEETLEPTWDLVNTQNVPVASGAYLFVVRVDGAVYQRGKIACVR